MHAINAAIHGLFIGLKSEIHIKLEWIATVLVIALGSYLKLNTVEWGLICLSIGFVLVTEYLNTSLEFLSDKVEPNLDVQIKYVKDLAAAAVLISVITAIIIGILIFAPKLLQ